MWALFGEHSVDIGIDNLSEKKLHVYLQLQCTSEMILPMHCHDYDYVTLLVVTTGPSCSKGSMWSVSVSVITVP